MSSSSDDHHHDSESSRDSSREASNDAYRLLFNAEVTRAAARFDTDSESQQQYGIKYLGASRWSTREQNVFYAALGRLGRDHVAGIAGAIGTKSIPETRELLLLLQEAEATVPEDEPPLTLRDIPAAFDVSRKCNEQLDLAAEALAWYEETCEANQEIEKYGDYWLITPQVAQDIETAIDSARSRATTSPPVSEPESSQRDGGAFGGSCTTCKKQKKNCDREKPCANCKQRKDKCVYPQPPDEPQENATTTPIPILEAIPEATLLQPHAMLKLSKTFFMNRSPTIPSPWAHWSEYTSDLAQEPAMYRSALNNFHSLVVSVTKRLVQTAIFQANSRLRSRRQRVDKINTPLLKKRDVLAAIDVLGMKRDGHERWRGVARRCGLRVDCGKWSHYKPHGTSREVPWDEVERILAPIDPLTDASGTTDGESSDDQLKPRATRTATRLRMEKLALSNPSVKQPVVERPPPTPASSKKVPRPQTVSLEQFDQNASHQEERVLCAMLDFEPIFHDEDSKSDVDSDGSMEEDEEEVGMYPDSDDWRSSTEYRAEWDEFDTPVSPSQFLANQKPAAVPPLQQSDVTDSANYATDASTRAKSKSAKSNKRRPQRTLALKPLDAQVYARHQGSATEHLGSRIESSATDSDVPTQSIETENMQPRDLHAQSSQVHDPLPDTPASSSEDSFSDIDMDVPAPSVETGGARPPFVDSDDEGEMDWSAYIE
ncbi:Zn-clus domain containing protein [Pyrenophora teres f. maculata]|nr:Zn-clus domain containing protein [Pyrenophora teres f. maculata]